MNAIQGILMPQLENRFRIFVNELTNSTITLQVVSCKIDLKNNSFILVVHQPVVDGGLLNEIRDMCHRLNRIFVDHMGGDGQAVVRLHFSQCRVTKHSYELDYAKSNIATHIIEFTFENIETVGFDQVKQVTEPGRVFPAEQASLLFE